MQVNRPALKRTFWSLSQDGNWNVRGTSLKFFLKKNTLTPLPQPGLQKNTLINQGFDRSCFTSKHMYPASTYVTFNGLILPVFIQYDAILLFIMWHHGNYMAHDNVALFTDRC